MKYCEFILVILVTNNHSNDLKSSKTCVKFTKLNGFLGGGIQ